jgi:hypothetical protein
MAAIDDLEVEDFEEQSASSPDRQAQDMLSSFQNASPMVEKSLAYSPVDYTPALTTESSPPPPPTITIDDPRLKTEAGRAELRAVLGVDSFNELIKKLPQGKIEEYGITNAGDMTVTDIEDDEKLGGRRRRSRKHQGGKSKKGKGKDKSKKNKNKSKRGGKSKKNKSKRRR